MKRAMVLLLNLLLLTRFEMAGAQEYRIAKENERGFQMLLDHLLSAYERPSAGDENRIASDLVRIRKEDEDDYEVARAIADHWRSVYLDGEYQLLLYHGEERAAELIGTGIPDSETHAFVVLGYALRNGEMTEELKGRCDAAAAAARAFPKAILVCSGGATGGNNPENHTEAGMMRDYLVFRCGLNADRVFIDEKAMTTLENAVNTFEILRERGIRTITVITSSYHQRWGQVLYNAMSALSGQLYGDRIEIVGNYSFSTEPSNKKYRKDARIAVQQLSSMLHLPNK